MKTIKEILAECKGKEDFKPHMMYDPKTGKGYKADTYADHVKMDKMGYTHEKPEVKESKSASGYDLYHRDFSGAMQHAYAHAKKKGFIVDKDEIDDKVAMGPKRPSKGKTNSYILGTNKKKNVHIQVANLDNKKYELNMYMESLEEAVDTGQYGARKTPKSSKKQKQRAFDKSRKRGNELRKMSDAEFKKWLNSDVEHDIEEGIKDSFDLQTYLENARAKRDAMRAMGKRGKDAADNDDFVASDDDRKAASKNVLMQIRKASDLPKGGTIEFEGGKKGKISQDDAKKVTKLFTMLRKPQDKAKFQKVISKDLKSLQGLLKRLGR